jgi:hypothetical protein
LSTFSSNFGMDRFCIGFLIIAQVKGKMKNPLAKAGAVKHSAGQSAGSPVPERQQEGEERKPDCLTWRQTD